MKIIFIFILIIFLLTFLFYFLKNAKYYPKNFNLKASKDHFGVTYSDKFARELGLDSLKVHREIVNDLQVKYIRLPIYWDEVEKKEGEYDFSKYDKLVKEGEKNNVNYILSVGYRLPRWPECHFPKWLDVDDDKVLELKLLQYLKHSVDHFKKYDNVIYWQVENEPYLNSFGICPNYNENLLKKEVSLVRDLDDRQIIISASGELGGWEKENKLGDIFATTLYRVVYNPLVGYFRYPLPAWYYKVKARSNGVDVNNSLLIELQAEPWIKSGTLADIRPNEYNKSFDIRQFKANIDYSIKTNFKQVYFWGVEWWYLQKTIGNDDYWDLAKKVFKN